MVNRSLNEVVCSISSGTTTNHQVKGTYVVYGSTGIIGYTDNPDYYGEKVLVARVGANAGTTNIVCGKYGVSDNTLIVEVKPENETKYIYYSLKYKKLNQLIFGSGQPLITGSLLKNITLYVPDKNSQQGIAEALSDVDSMISSLEKLIAKKKAVKQGAMQELLTGEKRLPGFEGDWKPIQLGSVSKIKTGDKNNEQKTDDGKYPFFVRSQQVERINSYSYDGEAILIPGEGNIGQIFHYINGKFDWHQRVYKISDFSEFVCGKYVYYQMKFSFGEHALKNTVKATVDSLRLPTFEQFEFLIPPIVEEQTAIASILSDIDNEIEALEQKLEKTRQIKQGMMQQLLTGKIRLV